MGFGEFAGALHRPPLNVESSELLNRSCKRCTRWTLCRTTGSSCLAASWHSCGDKVMRIYEFEVQEGCEWVAPVADTDFEIFRSFDGSAKLAGWEPVQMRLVREDEHGRPLLPADVPWLGKHAPVLKENASAALGSLLATMVSCCPWHATKRLWWSST